MHTQYLRKTRTINRQKQNVLFGVMIADTSNGELKLGYSVLNPEDEKIMAAENVKIRKQIAEFKKQNRRGKERVEGLPAVKPVFDKKEAVRLAQERMTTNVDLSTVPARIRRDFIIFSRKAIGRFYANKHLSN